LLFQSRNNQSLFLKLLVILTLTWKNINNIFMFGFIFYQLLNLFGKCLSFSLAIVESQMREILFLLQSPSLKAFLYSPTQLMYPTKTGRLTWHIVSWLCLISQATVGFNWLQEKHLTKVLDYFKIMTTSKNSIKL